MEFLISSVLGYLFGSFPTAYLVLKKTQNIDITKTGTGNVGAMNSYEVTNSKWIGILVFLIDALKGILSVLIMKIIFPDVFIFPALALVFAVLSHCYNPWLKFKGGRGLATSAGGAAFIFPFVLIVWVLLWAIIYLLKKEILFANIWAIIMSIIINFTSSHISYKYTFPMADSVNTLIVISTFLLIIIFIKHIEPLKELIGKKTFIKKSEHNEK
ncbi:MAG: glycerol-3-phosphate acyltransferase [Ignavibacteriaceae bacterium]